MTTFMGTLRSIRCDTGVPVPMRDGTTLYADVYHPYGDDKYPVLLQRTPYNKEDPRNRVMALDPLRAASHGYVVVIQDTRGRFASGGEFYPFLNEIEDGYDTVEWCASLPWSSGKVGMYGRSYVGATQWLAAIGRPPSLAAIAPCITASDYYEGWTYQGGALSWGFISSWTLLSLTLSNLNRASQDHQFPEDARDDLRQAIDGMEHSFKHLPLKEFPHLKNGLAPYFYDWISHPRLDDYWKRWRIEDFWSQMDIPALNIGGWHDIFLKGTVRNFIGMKEQATSNSGRNAQQLLIGPWHHTTPFTDISGDGYFGLSSSQAAIDLDRVHIRWFDHWLKGEDNGVADDPPVRIFVMGKNAWRYEKEWPLERTEYVDYFFHSGGSANSAGGDGSLSQDTPGSESPDVYLYDPRNPVPTRGGGLCCSPAFVPGGAYDQGAVEARPDVLVYTTAPLARDLEVTGPLSVTLYAATSAADTDFTAKLVDVSPCGCTRNLVDSIVRARYRESTESASFIVPGEVHRYTIDLVATSNVFQAGHSIRLEVSSSNFPRFDRNPNTATEPWEESEPQPAVQTVFHSQEYPSRITLPIIPS